MQTLIQTLGRIEQSNTYYLSGLFFLIFLAYVRGTGAQWYIQALIGIVALVNIALHLRLEIKHRDAFIDFKAQLNDTPKKTIVLKHV